MKKISDEETLILPLAEEQEEEIVAEKRKQMNLLHKLLEKLLKQEKKGMKLATNVLIQTASGSKVLEQK